MHPTVLEEDGREGAGIKGDPAVNSQSSHKERMEWNNEHTCPIFAAVWTSRSTLSRTEQLCLEKTHSSLPQQHRRSTPPPQCGIPHRYARNHQAR